MKLDLRATLAGLCGKSLTAVRVERHVYDEERSLISLWLETGGAGFKLWGTSYGYGLRAEDEPPRAYDMAEYGRIEVGGPDAAWHMSPGRIAAVWLVFAPESEEPVGTGIQVEGAAPVLIYCYDDELYVGARTAEELGTVRTEPLCGEPPPA